MELYGSELAYRVALGGLRRRSGDDELAQTLAEAEEAAWLRARHLLMLFRKRKWEPDDQLAALAQGALDQMRAVFGEIPASPVLDSMLAGTALRLLGLLTASYALVGTLVHVESDEEFENVLDQGEQETSLAVAILAGLLDRLPPQTLQVVSRLSGREVELI